MANYSPWRAISQTLVTDSDKWKGISDSAARLWLHMILRCDSFGCLDGDPYIVWARCTKAFGWTRPKTTKALQELVDADLVHVWTESDYEYAHIVDFDEHQHGEFLRKRGRRSLPEPPCERGGECESRTIRRRVRRTPKKQIQEQRQTMLSEDSLSASTGDADLGDDCVAVFDHWVEVDVATGGGQASGRILNRKRRDLIIARRREGYTVEQMKQAITAFCHDPWHQGKNERKKRYTGLYTLIKNGDKIEAGVQLFEQMRAAETRRGTYGKAAARV